MRAMALINHGWRRAAIAPVVLVLLAGCGGSGSNNGSERPRDVGNVVQPGAPGEPSRKLTAKEVAEIEQAKHTDADVRFMQEMVHHHGQAILMTKWVPGRTTSRDIRLMARRMQLSQETEIEQIEGWLRARDVKPRDTRDHAGHDHGSGEGLPPGMLTSRQLGRLYSADGRRFDRLFLRYMTFHHLGALTMVKELREAGGGAETEIGVFTNHVEADQGIEIARMRELSTSLR
jgi:uncharacterized protein (DUF305 family)